MGISLKYNEFAQKWELRGCEFVWQFNTKEEAEAKKHDAWEKHMRNLEARNFVINMMVQYRYL